MAEQKTPTITFNMIKSNYFRVVYAEGAWGGVTPKGDISFALYNERHALPQVTRLELKEVPGGLQAAAPEEILERKEGVVREVEVQVVMNLGSAISFHEWLGQKIKEGQEALGVATSTPTEA